ncbi:cupin domain-containing protein [Alkalimarinus alittae]|uniref:Cupin domain-containing protein n=1 Tax=Alkalimarinus alittae TaxID=2961619 RepID=A0ABY6N0R1_9ALTE|nr:cupin domain-containing protein [Alkalimarinus alittae]UZE95669.1 cupin domain-containing protein [Alkalimarinus alittae]
MISKDFIIKSLALTPHIEGGYFKRTYESALKTENTQSAMSSIYYLLTDDAPTGFFHQNKSDIAHYFHSGSPIKYTMISPNGELTTNILGPDLEFQLIVKGGYWKASQLLTGCYGLVSEAVCPGFEYSDMKIASIELMQSSYPTHINEIKHLIKPLKG